jgi:hypothetical protein|tara:strand:- start:78 stop:752 length:675 start_codon:yes stop_codon:yes gene_type:complete
MERTTVYRRALAPIMTYTGVVGLLAASMAQTQWQRIRELEEFALFWLCVGLVSLAGAFLLVRRQAIADKDSLLSPPTRRVFQSAAPLLCVGVFLGTSEIFWSTAATNPLYQSDPRHPITRLIALWLMCHGGAMHAMGFFMKRGIKLFGWVLILAGMSLYIALNIPLIVDKMPDWPNGTPTPDRIGHLLMGALFGGSHLSYGIYLYFTEEKPDAGEPTEEEQDEE